MRRIVAALIALGLLAALLATASVWSGGGSVAEPLVAVHDSSSAEELAVEPEELPQEEPQRRRVQPPVPAPTSEPDFDDEPAFADLDDNEPREDPNTFTVRVVDAAGTALRGVPASTFWGNTRHTDAAGEVSFRADGDAVTISLPSLGQEVRLTQPTTVVTATGARAVEARFVDLETGRPVDVRWAGDATLSSRRAIGWVVPGARASVPIEFEAPEGWIGPVLAHTEFLGATSRRATSLVVTVPVPREARVRVRVVRHDGTPAPGARIEVETGRGPRRGSARATTDEQGVADLRGLPYRRGETVRVLATLRDGDGAFPPKFVGEADPGPVLLDPSALVEATVRLSEESDHDVFEGPGTGGTIGIGGGGTSSAETALTSSLRVRARLRDGSPAALARLRLVGPVRAAERADDDGVYAFGGLAAGEYEVWLLDTGVVPTRVTVRVAEGENATVEIIEAAGRSLDVVVVDARGAPLPGATVRATVPDGLGTWDYAHVVDGVQHLRALTDARGRCRLVGLPAELGQVGVQFGSRSEWVLAGTDEGPVRVQVPDAK